MSAYNPPPVGYYGPGPGMMQPKKPVSITVMAILGLIVAALLLLCSPIGLWMNLSRTSENPIEAALMVAMREEKAWYVATLVQGVLSILIGVLVLLGSIGSFTLKRSARGLMLASAVLMLVSQVAGLVVHFTVALPALKRALSGFMINEAALNAGMGAMWIGVVLGVAFAVMVLVVYTRPHVKGAFENPEQFRNPQGGYGQPGYPAGQPGYPPQAGYAPPQQGYPPQGPQQPYR